MYALTLCRLRAQRLRLQQGMGQTMRSSEIWPEPGEGCYRLTRSEALEAIGNPLAEWDTLEAGLRLAAVQDDNGEAALWNLSEKDQEAFEAAAQIRGLIQRHIETMPGTGAALSARFCGSFGAVTRQRDGYETTYKGGFPLAAYLRFALEVLAVERMDCPGFFLFHDRAAEAAADFAAPEDAGRVIVLEPVPLDAAELLKAIEPDVFDKYEFLRVEALEPIPDDEPGAGDDTAQQPPEAQPEGTETGSRDAGQSEQSGGARPKKKRLEEDYSRMACVANALDKLRNGRGGREATDADIAREIVTQAQRRGTDIKPRTARDWLAAWRSLPRAQQDAISARALGRVG